MKATSTGEPLKPTGSGWLATRAPGPHKVGPARERRVCAFTEPGHMRTLWPAPLKNDYSGRTAAPGYHCAGKIIVEGRGKLLPHRWRRAD